MPSNSQLTFLANMTLANQWTLKLPASEAVHHLMTFDPSDSNYLYLMTSHHVSMWLLSLWLMCLCEKNQRTSVNSTHTSDIQQLAKISIQDKHWEAGGVTHSQTHTHEYFVLINVSLCESHVSLGCIQICRCWGWKWPSVTSGGAAVTVWEPGMPTVAGVPWRIGKKRFLSPQNSIYHVNCALSQLPRPLLPDRANLISVRFSVMHMPHAFWRNLADNATVLSVGSGAAVAVWVSDGFRLKLISKPGKMRLMGQRNEFSIYKHSNQGNDWDSFVCFLPLHSQFKSSHQCELSVISGFSTPVACFSFILGVKRSSLLLW